MKGRAFSSFITQTGKTILCLLMVLLSIAPSLAIPRPVQAAPSAPTGLTATAVSDTQVNLSWTNTAANAASITLQRDTSNTFNSISLTSMTGIAATATTYSDTTVTAGTTYYYRVMAYDALGDSLPSNTATIITTAGSTSIPTAPRGLTATAISGTQIDLGWMNDAVNQTSFTVDRATDTAFTVNMTSFTGIAATPPLTTIPD